MKIKMSLPTGTVTFLFTDIEGSTTLWQRHPSGMPDALVRHHAILRGAIESNGGHVFQIVAGCVLCGTTIGEVGLYLGSTRSASVWTEQPSTFYRLSADAIRQMESRESDLAAALHRWIARLMAERLADNNTTLAAVLD